MKNNHIRLAVILGSISIIGIILFQLYWINRTYSTTEQEFTQRVQIALYNVAEKVLAFNGHELPNENPVRQISSNYFIVDINDIIDASILDHYLKTEFDFRNMDIDYEYAIYDCETDAMVFGNYISTSNGKEQETKKFQKYDEFTYYFGIRFPSKTLFILNTMNIWFVSSLVLFTAVIFFGYAIYVILKQKRLSEIQKNFINNMTHEFKTPISTIGISARVLSEEEISKDPERFINYANIISDQNKRLEHQIDKVLQLARIETNKFKLKKEEIDLHELIQEVTAGFKHSVEENKGSVSLILEANHSLVVGDKHHISNVLYNLLDNAIKYCNGKPEIEISTITDNHSIVLSVSDNAIGIEKQYLKKIFNKFFRVPTGDIHNVKGFGIGLNYVKNVIDSHKWQITVSSEIGKGSTFSIKIPV